MPGIAEYIKYRLKAKGRHGVHSPFVYNFVDQCLKIDVDEKDRKKLKKIFTQLCEDERIITIDDHGAGSKKLSNERKVSDILKTSSSKGIYGELLYKLTRHYSPKYVLEMGTSLGIGTTYMHLGSPETHIVSIEGCKNTLGIAQEHLPESIELIHAPFQDYFEQVGEERKFDIVFVDGHHDGEALLRYMKQLERITHDDTIFLLDDIRWSSSMLKAWNELADMNEFHVSIDLFRMGILLRRPQQRKEHFVIKP